MYLKNVIAGCPQHYPPLVWVTRFDKYWNAGTIGTWEFRSFATDERCVPGDRKTTRQGEVSLLLSYEKTACLFEYTVTDTAKLFLYPAYRIYCRMQIVIKDAPPDSA